MIELLILVVIVLIVYIAANVNKRNVKNDE